MREIWNRLGSRSGVHPLLFAAFPVVFLWAHNLDEGVTTSQGVTALAAATTFSLVVLSGLRLLLKDWSRAAIAASAIVIMFLNFGRAEGLLKVVGGLPEELLLAEMLLLSLVAIAVLRKWHPPEGLTRTLNLVSLVLVVLNVVPIIAVQKSNAAEFRFPSVTHDLNPSASGQERDVYYLIFDRYAGAETLSKLYGFDNSAFYEWLSSHGFEVTKDALANYPQTTHSLASSLNMSYLDDLAASQGEDSSAWMPIRRTLQDTAVSRTFQAMGYKYEHIGSTWNGTAVDPSADDNYAGDVYSETLGVFLETTAVPAIQRAFGMVPDFARVASDEVDTQVRAFGEIALDPAPTFAFVHLLLPHPPYIFHADGSLVPSYPVRPVVDAYVDQLEYTNRVIEHVVTTLQAAPGPAPIIVIQSDEGPHPIAVDQSGEILKLSWSKVSDVELGRKLRILNAYYLPGDPAIKPYATITPANSFRMILDDYFGASLPLLPDRTYIFTDFDHPYRFEDVTDRLRSP